MLGKILCRSLHAIRAPDLWKHPSEFDTGVYVCVVCVSQDCVESLFLTLYAGVYADGVWGGVR